MPAENQEPEDTTDPDTDTEAETRPANPLEAIRRAQANRTYPGSENAGGRGGSGKGGNPKARRMYNRHK